MADVLTVGARSAQTQGVLPNRTAALARHGMTKKAPLLKELAEPRRSVPDRGAAGRHATWNGVERLVGVAPADQPTTAGVAKLEEAGKLPDLEGSWFTRMAGAAS